MSGLILSNTPPSPRPMNLGGILPAAGNAAIELEEAMRQEAQEAQNQPIIEGLAGHIRQVWETNKRAKRDIEERMLKAMRQRRGEYDPDLIATIRRQGSSEIYMMLTAAKCRAVSSWLRDVLAAENAADKPWTLDPTPMPDLPPDVAQGMMEELQHMSQQLMAQGAMLTPDQMREMVNSRRRELMSELKEEAKKRTEEMEHYMEDQLAEGGFLNALSQFIDDLSTFPAAIIKGPVLRTRRRLEWTGPPWEVQETESIVPEWERVSPFDLYPAPFAQTIHDGSLIERHSLSRADLLALIGVEGYDEGAIRAVLDEYRRDGLKEWLSIDSARAEAEGQSPYENNPNNLIDALQFWGSASGKDLLDWGLDPSEVEDPQGEYEIEAWLIGRWVIKAILNPDPLGRRPYAVTSYEKIPGLLWGNAPTDLVRDVQAVCNATARALVNNMGIASGPMVWMDIDRIPPGEDITNLYPWKIHQFTGNLSAGSQPPIGFFQPGSNAEELLAVYEKFSVLADEYTGIPRYMTGDVPSGSIGRTASGLSMLMGHAGKVMKQVVANIDNDIFRPLLERLYYYNMRYGENQEIKGDARVIARGMAHLVVKEAAQVRLAEFLQATMNDYDMQIIGVEGRAALLREAAKRLDVNIDKVIPDPDILRAKQQFMELQQQQQLPQPGGEQLMDGTPTTDNFSPTA